LSNVFSRIDLGKVVKRVRAKREGESHEGDVRGAGRREE
jgi:hypothetical protein